MGLFDFLKRGGKPEGRASDGKPTDRKLESLAKKAADKRAQSYDRDEAIRALIEMGTAEAAEALMKRFPFQVDPSITDQDEKQLTYDGIVAIGRGEKLAKRAASKGDDAKPPTDEELAALRKAVVDAARAACRGAENLTWQLKVLRALLPKADYERDLLDLLGGFDLEYTRNVEPKLNLLAAMENVKSKAVRQAVETYLGDVNETVRFHAVQTLYAQSGLGSLEPLCAMLEKEESMRVKNKVAEGVATNAWTIPPELLPRFQAALRDAHEYDVTAEGRIRKRK